MTQMGWMWKITVATAMDVRGMAAKNSAQFITISTPVAQATHRARPRSSSSRPRPVARHQASSASAPNAQRNHTVTSGCWAASSTNTPMVPSSTPPAMSSHWPSRSRVPEGSDEGMARAALDCMPPMLRDSHRGVKRIVRTITIR